MVSNRASENDKIDSKATDGLAGAHNSIAYRLEEVEKHFHSAGSWFGAAATPAGETHIADRVGPAIAAFALDAGDDDWGAWVQILGSDDTPARGTNAYFDPHLIVVTSTERTLPYFIQFSRGDSGAAGLSAGTYTEFVLDFVTNKGGTIVPVQTGRAPAGDKLWARCLCPGQNTAAMSFYIGLHEYIS